MKHEDKLFYFLSRTELQKNVQSIWQQEKKKSQNENSRVPPTALNWECVLTKQTQHSAGGFMEWVFKQLQPQGETEAMA